MNRTAESKQIDMLRDIPDLVPVLREVHDNWNIRVFDRKHHECRNYLSPNRRDFYKVLFVSAGTGIMTLGLHTYHIAGPTILFIHPNDIISWKRTSDESGGFYCLFRKRFIHNHPQLRAAIDRYDLFGNKSQSVIALEGPAVALIESHFLKMKAEEEAASAYTEDTMQLCLQLLLLDCMKMGAFAAADAVPDDYRYIHSFFDLLEKEASNINSTTPIGLKTAKEYASNLLVHPNYLNAVLKKHTGQNVSTHIRNRLLEETKVLLLQTDWTLQDIGYSIGFTEQSNFSLFFKKNTGLTPNEYRKQAHL